MIDEITVISHTRLPELFRYEIADSQHRKHTVEIHQDVLSVTPTSYARGTDIEHLETIACGTVLMDLDPESRFHKVDRSMVNRAYEAASRAQILGRLG